MPLETLTTCNKIAVGREIRSYALWGLCLFSVGLLPVLGSLAHAVPSSQEGTLHWKQATRSDVANRATIGDSQSDDWVHSTGVHSTGQVTAATWDSTVGQEDPLHDDSLWDDEQPLVTDPFEDADTESVAEASVDTAEHSVLVSPDDLQSLQLPGEADRSIRVAVLDDPFDDSDDPFEEPLIEEAGEEEMGEEETGEMEDPDDGFESEEPMTDLEQTDDPLEDDTDQSVTAPGQDTPGTSTLRTIESDAPYSRGPEREGDPTPESDREDSSSDTFSEWMLDRIPGEESLQNDEEELAKEFVESEKNCDEEFNRLRSARINSIDLSIRVAGKAGEDYPYECTLGSDQFSPRCWPQIVYLWKASGLCHKPLYFEQVQLERYGHSWGHCVQPLVSGAHFFASVPILPYKMGLKTPNECVYSLGYFRPGSCAPYLLDPVPFTWRAALFEAGFVVGAAAVIP